MKNLYFIIALIYFTASSAIGQVGINIDSSPPEPSAMLDVKSENKGVLIPRISFEKRNSIEDPAEGLMVFCIDCGTYGAISVFSMGEWRTYSPCVSMAPTSGIHVTLPTQITWNWNGVPGASGYKWNSLNDYNTAIDMGLITTKTETNLTCNTNYTRYVWAYYTCGTSIPLTITQSTSPCQTCPPSIVDMRDGKTYYTVLIGTQCWFKNNLNIGTRIYNEINQTNNGTIEKYCYNDDEDNCTIYGGLYQWAEIMNYTTSSNNNPSGRQGICPAGWHVPSDAEWCQLETYLDPTVNCSVTLWRGIDAGGKLKETGTKHWTSPNTGATNSSLFTALPSGHRNENADFSYLQIGTDFHSTTENSSEDTWYRSVYYNHAEIWRAYAPKTYGFAGRCCKD